MDYLDQKDWKKANMDKAERMYALRKPRQYTVGNSKTGYRKVKNHQVRDESIFVLFLVAVVLFLSPFLFLYV